MTVISTASAGTGLSGALDSGAASLTAAGQRLNGDASQVAKQGSDATGALLDTQQARLQAQAAVAVIRTSNAVLGTLLDIRA